MQARLTFLRLLGFFLPPAVEPAAPGELSASSPLVALGSRFTADPFDAAEGEEDAAAGLFGEEEEEEE